MPVAQQPVTASCPAVPSTHQAGPPLHMPVSQQAAGVPLPSNCRAVDPACEIHGLGRSAAIVLAAQHVLHSTQLQPSSRAGLWMPLINCCRVRACHTAPCIAQHVRPSRRGAPIGGEVNATPTGQTLALAGMVTRLWLFGTRTTLAALVVAMVSVPVIFERMHLLGRTSKTGMLSI